MTSWQLAVDSKKYPTSPFRNMPTFTMSDLGSNSSCTKSCPATFMRLPVYLLASVPRLRLTKPRML